MKVRFAMLYALSGVAAATLLVSCAGADGVEGFGEYESVDSGHSPIAFDDGYRTQSVLAASCPSTGVASLLQLNGGVLEYCPYTAKPYPGSANGKPGNLLPDFSFAGYRGMTAEAIPTWNEPGKVVPVSPGVGDDQARIQDAITQVSGFTPNASGHRGVVQLAAGTYELATSLSIQESGVVLRGAGQGLNGTILKFAPAENSNLLKVGSSANVKIVEAEAYTGQFGVTTDTTGSLTAVNGIGNGDWLRYDDFSFTGIQGLTLSMSGIHDGSVLRIRTGSEVGEVIGECTTPNTGSWTSYRNFTCPVSKNSGTADLFLTFHRSDSGGVGRVDYFRSRAWSEVPGSQQTVTTPYVPAGTATFSVADASPFSPNDEVMIFRVPKQAWIDALAWPLDDDDVPWTLAEYELVFERRILSKSGNQLTIDAPLVQALDQEQDVSYVIKADFPRKREIGIEHLRLESSFQHDTAEDHGENAIYMQAVEDSWVRNVTAKYFGYSLARLSNTRFVTVQDCALTEPKSVITGGRRYTYSLAGLSSMNLFQRLYAAEGRHVHVMGARVPGPNVFLDNASEYPYAEDGPHQRYATGVLYDNIKGSHNATMGVQNATDRGTGHGWVGAQVVLWNNEIAGKIKLDSPPGATNFSLGTASGSKESGHRFEAWVDLDQAPAAPITPRSLYLQQLKDRLGQAALDRVATTEQQYGHVWNKLSMWRGEPFLVDQSFDTMMHAQPPAGWTVNAAGGQVQVIGSSNRVLRLDDTNAADVVAATKTFSPTAGTVVAQFRIRLTSGLEDDGLSYVTLRSGETAVVRLRTIDGELQIENSDGSYTTLHTPSAAQADDWRAVRVVADPDVDRVDVYVDGISTTRQRGFKASATSLDRIEFKTHSTSTGRVEVDDVWVASHPVGLSENFNAMPTGGAPSRWTFDTPAGTSASVANLPSSSNRSMRLSDTSSSNTVKASRAFSASDSRVVVETKVMFDTVGADKIYYIKILGSTGNTTDLSEAIRISGGNGSLSVQEGSSYTQLRTYQPNVWYRLKVIAYPAQGTCDIYIDDVRYPALAFKSQLPILNQLEFVTHTAATGENMYVDDVIIRN